MSCLGQTTRLLFPIIIMYTELDTRVIPLCVYRVSLFLTIDRTSMKLCRNIQYWEEMHIIYLWFSCLDQTTQVIPLCVYRVSLFFVLFLSNYWPDSNETLLEYSILRRDAHVIFIPRLDNTSVIPLNYLSIIIQS